MHTAVCSDGEIVSTFANQLEESVAPPQPNQQIEEGDWVVVQYDQIHYPGEVTKIVSGEYEVIVLHRHDNHFKWPAKEDRLFYSKKQIVKKLLGPPTLSASFSSNNRFFWEFTDYK